MSTDCKHTECRDVFECKHWDDYMHTIPSCDYLLGYTEPNYPVPAIPRRIDRTKDGSIWFYNDNKPWPTSCTCVIGPNQSGGMTMTAQFTRELGIKAWFKGTKVFNKTTRRWE